MCGGRGRLRLSPFLGCHPMNKMRLPCAPSAQRLRAKAKRRESPNLLFESSFPSLGPGGIRTIAGCTLAHGQRGSSCTISSMSERLWNKSTWVRFPTGRCGLSGWKPDLRRFLRSTCRGNATPIRDRREGCVNSPNSCFVPNSSSQCSLNAL